MGAGVEASGGATGSPHASDTDALLDDAPCGFLSFADDGMVEVVNATLLRMLGYERAEVVGRHVETILAVGSRIFYQTHLFPLLALHGRADEIFLLLRPKAGGDLGALLNAARRERGGRFVNDCVLMEVKERRKFEDALLRAKQAAEAARAELEHANARLEDQAVELETQQQQLQDQAAELMARQAELETMNAALRARTEELEHQRAIAEDANRAKSTFLAVMSHELRTPLNAIAGYAQLLDLGVHGPINDEQREALDRIVRSQRHLLRLINDVLNLARIEAGRVDYQIRDVLLADAVAAVMPMVEPQLGAKGIAWRVDVGAGIVVLADREKVEQIVLNLLTNATKFTTPGGRVTITATAHPERAAFALLQVQDTGVGIAPEMQGKIFEPFVRVDASHVRATEGTGLGLAISRDLARGMGGDLTVDSTLGAGSTFSLSLPRR